MSKEDRKKVLDTIRDIVSKFGGYCFVDVNESGFVIYPKETPYGSFVSATFLNSIDAIDGVVFVSVMMCDGRMLATFAYE